MRRVPALALALLALACSGERPRVRLVHAAAGSGVADLLVDGELVVLGVAFGRTSDWIEVRPGASIDVRTPDTMLASGAIAGSGDHLVVVTTAFEAPLPITARLPAPARRGVELLLVAPTEGTSVTVADRPGLSAVAEPDRAAPLVLPTHVESVRVSVPTESAYDVDLPALAARSRVAIVPVGRENHAPNAFGARALLAIDLDAPRLEETSLLSPRARIHVVMADALAGATVRVDGVDAPSCSLDRSCIASGIDVASTSATVELVGMDAVPFVVSDLAPGDDRLVIATGAPGSVQWMVLTPAMQPIDLAPFASTTYVHAAPALGALDLFPTDDFRATRARRLARGGTVTTGATAALARAGGPVETVVTSTGVAGFVVITSTGDTLDTIEVASVAPGPWSIAPVPMVRP